MLLSNSVFRTEVNDDVHSIYFTHAKRVALTPIAMWQGLEQAMTDTRASWLWPEEFSIHRPEVLPLAEGGYFNTTYRMTHPDTHKTSEYQYRYRMVRWRPDEYLFEYQAQKGHPFRGGGVVTLQPLTEGGVLFTWDGVYQYTSDRAGAEEIFSWYFPTFFRRMDQKIKAYVAIAV